MAVEDDLTGSGAGLGDTQTINDVVETALEKLEKDFTGDTLDAGSFLEEVVELALENTISIFGLLLLTELNAILCLL